MTERLTGIDTLRQSLMELIRRLDLRRVLQFRKLDELGVRDASCGGAGQLGIVSKLLCESCRCAVGSKINSCSRAHPRLQHDLNIAMMISDSPPNSPSLQP